MEKKNVPESIRSVARVCRLEEVQNWIICGIWRGRMNQKAMMMMKRKDD